MAEATLHRYAKQRLAHLHGLGVAFAFHVPNGLKRSGKTGGMLKNMGARAGAPDFCVIARGGGFWALEIKDAGGTLSQNQKDFRDDCEAVGAVYTVAETFDQVDDFIRRLQASVPSEAA